MQIKCSHRHDWLYQDLFDILLVYRFDARNNVTYHVGVLDALGFAIISLRFNGGGLCFNK